LRLDVTIARSQVKIAMARDERVAELTPASILAGPCALAAAAGVPSVFVGDAMPPKRCAAVASLDVRLEELFARASAALMAIES
jgi:hypothetical protein